MNIWTKKSIELANQRNYLDLLYKVYPMSINLNRELDENTCEKILISFEKRDNIQLISSLLDLEIFPIKDSYVSYMRRDKTSIKRNPQTVARISSILYDMGYEEIIKKSTIPKETNRQIGPMFKDWVGRGNLGVPVTKSLGEFHCTNSNIILNTSDSMMKEFAKKYLNYTLDKGLDFIAKINGKYIVAEAKFLTDFGGHQTAQMNDALNVMNANMIANDGNEVIKISILDGVLFIKNNQKMHTKITTEYSESVIISSVLLKDYLCWL